MNPRTFGIGLVTLSAALAAGCQQDAGTANLPPPRLVTPAPRPPAQQYAIVPRAPTTPAPNPLRNRGIPGDIPAGWAPAVAPRAWNWIVIHHSDSAFGSAALIDKWHKDRGFDELGYHFVIGNGTNSGDGQVEIGPRWAKQKWGAHDNALDNRFNTNGIGICLVGNFDKTRPTAAQKRSLIRLVTYLMKTYHIPASRVLGHGETKDTDCPGKYLRIAEIRALVAQGVADSGANGGAPLAAR